MVGKNEALIQLIQMVSAFFFITGGVSFLGIVIAPADRKIRFILPFLLSLVMALFVLSFTVVLR